MGYITHKGFESLQSLNSYYCKFLECCFFSQDFHKKPLVSGQKFFEGFEFHLQIKTPKLLAHHLSNWKFGSTSISTHTASCYSCLCNYKVMQVYSKPSTCTSLKVDLCFSNFLFKVRKILIFNKRRSEISWILCAENWKSKGYIMLVFFWLCILVYKQPKIQ